MKRALTFILCCCLISLYTNAQGTLQFNQVKSLSSADGLVTVPSGKVWKIESMNGGGGTITTTFAVSNNCGTTCSGGSCGSSSCTMGAYQWELNGSPLNLATTCVVCSGSNCVSSISNCPVGSTFTVSSNPTINTPIWLTGGNTMKVNVSSLYFSVLEFNVIP